ncbi:MAG: RluA family pseudouridine synthase [Alicyclobacillus sp.]|nr:RluA family pseudouridine synthase [Alicyclobacillus sp.]
MQTRWTVEAGADDEGLRLDLWLTQALEDEGFDVSRSQVQSWLRDGRVSGPRLAVKASDKVVSGEVYVVCVPEPEPVVMEPESMDLDIVYEDADVIVVNKARGVVVHPGAGHHRGTLVAGLLGRGVPLSPLGGGVRPGVVHRIDKDTSGLLVFAKTDLAYHKLAEQLRLHTMTRQYRAIVHGALAHDHGTVDAPIGRDPNHRQRMAVRPSGKPAVTHFRVLHRFPAYSDLELRLETGRTHQIRVHMAYIGHPLAGDPVYGPRHTLPIDGQALHAATLGFVHPRSGETLTFEAPLPDDMVALLHQLTEAAEGRGAG